MFTRAGVLPLCLAVVANSVLAKASSASLVPSSNYSLSTSGSSWGTSRDSCLSAMQTLLPDVHCLEEGFWEDRPGGCLLDIVRWKASYNGGGEVNTQLVVEAHVGDTTIVIVESAAVVAGDQVVVSAGTVQAEIVTVVGFGSCAAHRCTVNLQTALHQDHAAGAAVTALHKNYYGLCVGLIPKDKVQKLPLKPILPPLPKVTYPVGHCEHKYPAGIMGSNATDCDEAVLGGVASCLHLRTVEKGVNCDGCGLCPEKDVYIEDANVTALVRMGGYGGKYACPGVGVSPGGNALTREYFVGAGELDEFACTGPLHSCKAMAGVGGSTWGDCEEGAPIPGAIAFKVICGAAPASPPGCVSDPNFWVGIPAQNCAWFADRYPIGPPGLPKGGVCQGFGGAAATKACCNCGGGFYGGTEPIGKMQASIYTQ